jgi:hypothetical protein
VFSREFFHQLEDEINRARYEIDEKYHMGFLDFRKSLWSVPDKVPVSITNHGDMSVYVVGDKEITAPTVRPVEEVAEVFNKINEKTMNPIDRIRQKALAAKSLAPALIKEFESDLDALIAEGPKLKAAKEAAVGQHMEAFAGLRGEFDGLKSVIDVLSNGGPSLDPLPESDTSAPASGT